MTPRLRKFALTAHLTFSVGWICAVIAYLALVVTAMSSQDSWTLRAAWIAMELIGWLVRHRPVGARLATHRAYHGTGYSVGLVPALLGRVIARAHHRCHHRLAGTHADSERRCK
jgi:hypothetical protein